MVCVRGEKRKMYLAAYLGVVVKQTEPQRKLEVAPTVSAKESLEKMM